MAGSGGSDVVEFELLAENRVVNRNSLRLLRSASKLFRRRVNHLFNPSREYHHLRSSILCTQQPPHTKTMASFFDLKARRAAAIAAQKEAAPSTAVKDPKRLVPWVEK